jgi:hypothetical protein
VFATAILALAATPIGVARAASHAVVVDGGGRVIDVNTSTGRKRLISDNATSLRHGGGALFSDLFGIGRESNGNFVVINRVGGYPPNPGAHVIRVDSRTGKQTALTSSPNMGYSLVSIVVAPNHDILVGDENVPTPGYNGDTVIWRVRPNGALSIFSNDAKSDRLGGDKRLEAAQSLTTSPDGTVWDLASIGGSELAPADPSDFVGSIVKINPHSGKGTIFTSNFLSRRRGGAALFREGRAMVRAPNGDFFITDDPAINNSAKYGADDTRIIRVDGRTGKQSLVSDNAKSRRAGGKGLFFRPHGIALQRDGKLLVVDFSGRLIRINPNSGVQSLVTSGLGVAVGVVMGSG